MQNSQASLSTQALALAPVILSGGSGTRLWPVSRASHPKQFSQLFERPLFDLTYARLEGLGSPWILTTESLRTLTQRSVKGLKAQSNQVIYEPRGRNTAAAVALLCTVMRSRGHVDTTVGLFPADQLIQDLAAFHAAVRAALVALEQEPLELVTLGLRPSHPATGYGYIELSAAVDWRVEQPKALRAAGFREKPKLEQAQQYIKEGSVWNAGIFFFKPSRMIELLAKHAPEVWEPFSKLTAEPTARELAAIYEQVPSISIDYAVMEKLEGHLCVPVECGWSDVGSWDAVAEISLGSDLGKGGIATSANQSYIKPALAPDGQAKTYALVGVEGLVIVDTPDATLIAKRGESEKIKGVLEGLQAQGNSRATAHPFEHRPWGSFEILRDSHDFKSKVIVVDPGQQISYQSHAKRAEHWIIVSGTGEVVLNDETIPVRAGSHVFIPVGAKHRIRNTSPSEPIRFVEVQLGSYFGEDDIVRYQDDYKRS
jgi:mannose-1-phosphate guanylyltransferase/mannose-1-phosphate guanylyltransferase/mannose-6-phosphate isomerase